ARSHRPPDRVRQGRERPHGPQTRRGQATLPRRCQPRARRIARHRATLSRIARLAVPGVADIAAVYTFEDHQPTRLERVEADPRAIRTLREIERRYPGEAERL